MQQAQSAPPPPITPAPSTPAPPPGPGAVVVGARTSAAGASDIYHAFKAQREELGEQLETLEDKREELSQRLEEPMVGGADRAGLEARIAEIDARISAVDKQIAAADAEVARAASIPGAVVEEPPTPREGPPEEVFVLGGMFIFVVLLPLTIAYSRRIWRRGAAVVASIPQELADRLTRLEQGVDAIAVEVERIGEGQRYMTRMFATDGSHRALGEGAAQPIDVKAREAAAVQQPRR
jgi:outer membrane murein-binding lipoprotein Lpp